MTEQQIPKEMKELRDEIISDITAALVSRDKEILRLREALENSKDTIKWLIDHTTVPEYLQSDFFNIPANMLNQINEAISPNPIPVDGQEK